MHQINRTALPVIIWGLLGASSPSHAFVITDIEAYVSGYVQASDRPGRLEYYDSGAEWAGGSANIGYTPDAPFTGVDRVSSYSTAQNDFSVNNLLFGKANISMETRLYSCGGVDDTTTCISSPVTAGTKGLSSTSYELEFSHEQYSYSIFTHVYGVGSYISFYGHSIYATEGSPNTTATFTGVVDARNGLKSILFTAYADYETHALIDDAISDQLLDEPYAAGWEYQLYLTPIPITEVPVPGAFWLFGTALLGVVGISRQRRRRVYE